MKLRFILAAMAAMLLAVAAQGQDLKPVRDKATKLYGYQDKEKNWVIEPGYDNAKRFKDGLAEVIVKVDKKNYHGIIDEQGRTVVPADCKSLNINYKQQLIYAERTPGGESGWLWGVYDFSGKEIWAPQFTVTPTFYDGRGIARSGWSGLEGVIDLEGNVLIPFENLALERAFGGYEALTRDFVRVAYDSRLNKTSEYAYPGYVLPYDPAEDPVRAAAWHVGPIGYRMHRNNLRLVQMTPGRWSASATCTTLPIDWGDNRFVRLEPVVDTAEHPGSMQDPFSGKFYTVKAVLCEANGTPVADISSWGWIEAEYYEGAVYNAEGKEIWMAMRDVNCPAMPSFTVSLSRARTIDNGSVLGGLGIPSYELENMYDPERLANRSVSILTGENAGITYKLPPEAPSIRMSRTLNEIHRTPLFRQRFRLGDIYSCRVHSVEGGVELDLEDEFVCRYSDRFSDPYFSMEGKEVLFWGPSNDYTVVLSARQAPHSGEFTKDDVYGSDGSFCLALELYDEYDRYVQTVAEAPHVDYVADGWLVFEKEGIALRLRNMRYGGHPGGHPGGRSGDRPDDRRPDARPDSHSSYSGPGRVKLTAERLPATLSALQKATDTPHR